MLPMPFQSWNEIQIENSTGNAPNTANTMKNGATATYCGKASRYLFGGRVAGTAAAPTVVGTVLLVTAIQIAPARVSSRWIWSCASFQAWSGFFPAVSMFTSSLPIGEPMSESYGEK